MSPTTVLEVNGRAALAHGHQLVKLEGQRVPRRKRRVDGQAAYPARLAERPHAPHERVPTGAAAWVSLRHLAPPIVSRMSRSLYVSQIKRCRMVPRGSAWCWFFALARPDHAEVEVARDASAASRRMKKAPPDASSGATLSPKAVGAINHIMPRASDRLPPRRPPSGGARSRRGDTCRH